MTVSPRSRSRLAGLVGRDQDAPPALPRLCCASATAERSQPVAGRRDCRPNGGPPAPLWVRRHALVASPDGSGVSSPPVCPRHPKTPKSPTARAWCPARRSGFLRHTARSAEGCCRQALTRFAAPRCAGPDRRARHQAHPLPGRTRTRSLHASLSQRWRGARAAESARLEIVCGETHRGFKSHPLRAQALVRACLGAVRCR